MADILIDIEVTIPQQQFLKFKELADLTGKTVPETMERCLFDKCDELLKQYKENVPEEEQLKQTK